MLTFTLARGFLQIFIDGVETSWGTLIQKRYDLSTENYQAVLDKIETDPHCANVQNVLRHNFKAVYHANFRHEYNCVDGIITIDSVKPFVIDRKEVYSKCTVSLQSDRNFNYMTIESAEHSLSVGVAIECNGDHRSVQYCSN